MTFSEFDCHTNPLFIKLKLLKVRDVIKSQQLKLIYDYHKNMLPADIHNLFVLISDVHVHDNRYAKYLLHIPEIQTATYGNKSIKYHCPSIWNNTVRHGISVAADKTVNIERINNVFQFKRTTKKHFLYTYSLE